MGVRASLPLGRYEGLTMRIEFVHKADTYMYICMLYHKIDTRPWGLDFGKRCIDTTSGNIGKIGNIDQAR